MFDKFYAQLLAFTHTRTRTHARSSLCRSKITSSFSPLRRASPGGAVLGKKKKKNSSSSFRFTRASDKKSTRHPPLSLLPRKTHTHTHTENTRARTRRIFSTEHEQQQQSINQKNGNLTSNFRPSLEGCGPSERHLQRLRLVRAPQRQRGTSDRHFIRPLRSEDEQFGSDEFVRGAAQRATIDRAGFTGRGIPPSDD